MSARSDGLLNGLLERLLGDVDVDTEGTLLLVNLLEITEGVEAWKQDW